VEEAMIPLPMPEMTPPETRTYFLTIALKKSLLEGTTKLLTRLTREGVGVVKSLLFRNECSPEGNEQKRPVRGRLK
jgi:hypothetical protein